MTKTKMIVIGSSVTAMALAGAVGAVAANVNDGSSSSGQAVNDDKGEKGDDGGREDADKPITSPDKERAEAAALAHLGKGKVTETEVGDEESYYEVEVQLPNGTSVDVQLDKEFNVVSADGD